MNGRPVHRFNDPQQSLDAAQISRHTVSQKHHIELDGCDNTDQLQNLVDVALVKKWLVHSQQGALTKEII